MNGIGNLKRIALDSNLFIYHFEDNTEFAPHAERIFERLIQNSLKAVTSVISIIETLSFPSPPRVVREITEAFLNIPNLEILEVNQTIATEAARIRREYGFRLPDSVQLATALFTKTQAFVSNDVRLKQFKELRVILLKQI